MRQAKEDRADKGERGWMVSCCSMEEVLIHRRGSPCVKLPRPEDGTPRAAVCRVASVRHLGPTVARGADQPAGDTGMQRNGGEECGYAQTAETRLCIF